MEITKELYNEYDIIVANASGMIQYLTNKKRKIYVEYKKNILNDFLLRIVLMNSNLYHKDVYIKTNIFTYLKLKKIFGKNIHYSLFKSEIDLFGQMINFCEHFKIDSRKIQDVYNAYYNN